MTGSSIELPAAGLAFDRHQSAGRGPAADCRNRMTQVKGMAAIRNDSADVVVVGGGIAGITAALELLDQGLGVILLDGQDEARFGGQARDAFGGMLLVGTPEQRRLRIPDTPELALADWQRCARFPHGERWAPRWAESYLQRSRGDVYDWLHGRGIRFYHMVQWPERGNDGDGNSVPRYHIAWGCGRGLMATLAGQLLSHPRREHLQLRFRHRVADLVMTDGAVTGVTGSGPEGEFVVSAAHVVIASGGINGNPEKVRQHWDPTYGPAPENLLFGTSPAADGYLHDRVAALGGQVVNLNQMWNYAAGIAHPQPRFPDHGLSLIPARSALWLDREGRRVGPHPLMTGFDTHELCRQLGHLPGQYGWLLMNQRIAMRELSIAHSDENPHFRDHRLLPLVWERLTGNHRLFRRIAANPDVAVAGSFSELAERMNAITGEDAVNAWEMEEAVRVFDDNIRRGGRFYNDEQIRRIQHLRQWWGDRQRTLRLQPINDGWAGPFVAIRTRLISRKSMGGMLTDLHSRVLDDHGMPIPGLYAAGEAAGFGGGGIAGQRSLEGTFLSCAIFNARVAARAIAGAANP